MPLWMKTGTINLVNGSKNVVGVGTQFITATVPARPGQPLVINGVLWEIENITSNTALTLALPYTGATANSVAYTILTTMEGSFNDLARRASQVMGAYQAYMDVYQALFTGTGNVTVTLPDGGVITLPAWNTMQPKSTNLSALSAVSAAANKLAYFTSASTATTTNLSSFGRTLIAAEDSKAARVTLDVLQNGRIKMVSTTAGKDWNGFAGFADPGSGKDQFVTLSVDDAQNAGPSSPGAYYGTAFSYGAGFFATQLLISDNGIIRFRSSYIGTPQPWYTVRTTANTTVDSNGFLKNASPILHLYHDGAFKLENVEKVTAERLSVGVYRISGALGFHEDGWYIEGPKDANGRMKFWLDYDQDLNGIINIKTTHREFTEGPASQRNIIPGVKDGDPVDIPVGREITVRLSMPEPDRGYE